MAVLKGRDGIVKVGSDTLGRVTAWSYSADREYIDATSMGDANEINLTGHNRISGTVTCRVEAGGDTAQDALVSAQTGGTSVTLELYFEGDDTTSGARYLTGDAVIGSNEMAGAMDGTVDYTFNFRAADGAAWTVETVAP